MDMNNYLHFDNLAWELRLCVEEDSTFAKQLDIYPQLISLYNYFKNCVFFDNSLEQGKTYILPIDVEVDMLDEEDYAEFTDPASEQYEPDLAPFVESHNKHMINGMVGITLNKGTQFIFDGYDGHGGMTLLIDGYPLEWYGYLINDYDYDGAVPFVFKA